MNPIPGYDEWKFSSPKAPAVMGTCPICGNEITENSEYYSIQGYHVCTDIYCVNEKCRELMEPTLEIAKSPL